MKMVDIVSILVLMEVTLKEGHVTVVNIYVTVSILVLMEVTLKATDSFL